MATYIVLMGVQGAGKGTQAAILTKACGIPHVTTGGLFREMECTGTPLAREIQEIMKRGDLVPDSITIQVVRGRLQQPDAEAGAIFDGFPRTRNQAEALDKLLAELGGKVTIVPFFSLERDEAIRRISGRWECCKDPKHVYNRDTNPPKRAGVCDIDGAALRQRPDDTPQAAAHRIDLYFSNTAPLLEYYRERGLLYEINANQTIEQVAADTLAAIEKTRSGSRTDAKG